MHGTGQRASRAALAMTKASLHTGREGHTVVRPRRISLEPDMLARLPSAMTSRLLHASASTSSRPQPPAYSTSIPDHSRGPRSTLPEVTEADIAAQAEAGQADSIEGTAHPTLVSAAPHDTEVDSSATSLLPPSHVHALVRPAGGDTALQDEGDPQDVLAATDADARGPAELVRQCSMAVQPSTTLDRWPQADIDPEPELHQAAADGSDLDLDDWTPVRRQQLAAPRADALSTEQLTPRSARSAAAGSSPSATGAAMYRRAVASRRRKEAR